MEDIVPGLIADISASYRNRMELDRRVLTVNRRIRDGTANLMDAHLYAERAGVNMSNAMLQYITEENLPNGVLYYNIAERTVPTLLLEDYEAVNLTAADIQRIMDRKAKIGLTASKADFPEERIEGLVRKMTEPDLEFAQRLVWLKEPIVNNSEAFFDDFVKKNAEVRTQIGLKAIITRTVFPGCCSWCDELAGTYEYGKEPADIYRRHENCRCEVTYQTERTSQDVWSKQKWESTPEELERRRNYTPKIKMRG